MLRDNNEDKETNNFKKKDPKKFSITKCERLNSPFEKAEIKKYSSYTSTPQEGAFYSNVIKKENYEKMGAKGNKYISITRAKNEENKPVVPIKLYGTYQPNKNYLSLTKTTKTVTTEINKKNEETITKRETTADGEYLIKITTTEKNVESERSFERPKQDFLRGDKQRGGRNQNIDGGKQWKKVQEFKMTEKKIIQEKSRDKKGKGFADSKEINIPIKTTKQTIIGTQAKSSQIQKYSIPHGPSAPQHKPAENHGRGVESQKHSSRENPPSQKKKYQVSSPIHLNEENSKNYQLQKKQNLGSHGSNEHIVYAQYLEHQPYCPLFEERSIALNNENQNINGFSQIRIQQLKTKTSESVDNYKYYESKHIVKKRRNLPVTIHHRRGGFGAFTDDIPESLHRSPSYRQSGGQKKQEVKNKTLKSNGSQKIFGNGEDSSIGIKKGFGSSLSNNRTNNSSKHQFNQTIGNNKLENQSSDNIEYIMIDCPVHGMRKIRRHRHQEDY